MNDVSASRNSEPAHFLQTKINTTTTAAVSPTEYLVLFLDVCKLYLNAQNALRAVDMDMIPGTSHQQPRGIGRLLAAKGAAQRNCSSSAIIQRSCTCTCTKYMCILFCFLLIPSMHLFSSFFLPRSRVIINKQALFPSPHYDGTRLVFYRQKTSAFPFPIDSHRIAYPRC